MNPLGRFANLTHRLRSGVPAGVWRGLLNGHYRMDFCAAVFRGLASSSLGRCSYEDDWRPFVLGPRVKFHLEKGAAIVLSKRIEPPVNGSSLELGLAETSALGFRVHWKFMNPPSGRPTAVRLQEDSRLVLGPNVSIMPGAYLSVWPGQELVFEEDSATGIDIYISTRCGLRIGKGAMLGHQVKIMDYDGHPIIRRADGEVLDDGGGYGGRKRPIEIGRFAWIGFQTTILKGVRIGEGSIVGANSVVTHDVPPFSVVAGNPAKVVLEDIQWRRY